MTSIISRGERTPGNTTMKENKFSLIADYQNMVKMLNEKSDCDDVTMGLDHEVPISSFCCDKSAMRLDILDQSLYCEVPNNPNQPKQMANNSPNFTSCYSSNTNSYTDNSRNCNIPIPVYADDELSSTDSTSMPNQDCFTYASSSPSPSPFWSTISTSLPSTSSPAFQRQSATQNNTSSQSFSSSSFLLSSSSPSPSSSSMFVSSSPAASAISSYSSSLSPSPSPLLSAPPATTNAYSIDTKSKVFVSELGGSGCTLLSSSLPNFLSSECTDMVSSRNQQESLEYTDLDKLSDVSLYDDLMSTKKVEPSGEMPLEAMVEIMRDVIEHDRKELNLSPDPHTWSCNDVARWVRWVCQKNGVHDISCHLGVYNGTNLCALSSDSLRSQFGTSGSSVVQELELWESVNNYNSSPSSVHDVSSSLQSPCLESTKMDLTPSSSPAPSNSSTNSQDSQHMFNCSLDNSEDEVFYSENERPCPVNRGGVTTNPSRTIKSETFNNKHPFIRTTGRGHKKAITLWRFLLELLVGNEDHSDCIRWLNREARVFKIEDSKKVATLWGSVKSRPNMNYDKLSRSVRQYYKKGIIKKPEQTKRLVYQFCSGIC